MEPGNLKTAVASIKKARQAENAAVVRALPETINGITHSFRSHGRQENLPLAERLLKAFEEGIPVPVLTVCGRGTREIRFTSYLAYFLDPGNRHGLGTLFVETVLRPETIRLPDGWADHCQVIPDMGVGLYKNKGKAVDCW